MRVARRDSLNPPLSLYVHLPWCVRKCPYCDFNSHKASEQMRELDYVQALLKDLQQELALTKGRTIRTVFFGGGTPSLFSAESIAAVLEAVRPHLSAQAEITLEANPGTAEAARFQGYRAAGVNRLSIGAQSFADDKLRALGRIHDSKEILAACQAARQAGFDNINIDLMHGLPAQSVDEALSDLEQAIALGPEHLSWYQLTLEPGTPFHHRPPPLPDDERRWEIQQCGGRLLRSCGYRQYEVSAWATPGMRCRHNLNYWRFGDYMGVGAGAHGKISGQGIQRRVKLRMPGAYMRSPTDPQEVAPLSDAAQVCFEFLLNALRLNDGFTRRQFESRTGLTFDFLLARLRYANQQGLIAVTEDRVRPTALGRRFLDSILTDLLPEAA